MTDDDDGWWQYRLFFWCVFYYYSHFFWLLTILLDTHHLFTWQQQQRQQTAKPPIKWRWTMTVQAHFFLVCVFLLLFTFLLTTYNSFRHPPLFTRQQHINKWPNPPLNNDRWQWWTTTQYRGFFSVCIFFNYSHFFWLPTILLDIHHPLMRWWQHDDEQSNPPLNDNDGQWQYRGSFFWCVFFIIILISFDYLLFF